MKKHFLLPGMLAMALFSGCELLGIQTDEDKEQLRRDFLVSRTWEPIKVMNEGVDITSEFSDFELEFTSSFISTINGGLAFPEEIGWQFGLDINSIERDDDITMDITKINEGSRTYTLKFTIDEPELRTKGIYGSYEFRFEAK